MLINLFFTVHDRYHFDGNFLSQFKDVGSYCYMVYLGTCCPQMGFGTSICEFTNAFRFAFSVNTCVVNTFMEEPSYHVYIRHGTLVCILGTSKTYKRVSFFLPFSLCTLWWSHQDIITVLFQQRRNMPLNERTMIRE